MTEVFKKPPCLLIKNDSYDDKSRNCVVAVPRCEMDKVAVAWGVQSDWIQDMF